MSVINLDSQVVKTIGSEIATLDTTLLQGYFPKLESELAAIASNVKGEELHAILNTLNSQFSSVKADLSVALPKLENFLEEQVTSYTQNEEELDSELTPVVAKMNNIIGNMTTSDGTTLEPIKNIDDKNSTESTSPEMAAVLERLEALEKQNAELVAQNKELSKTDVQRANDEFLREAGADNAEFAERFTNDWTNVGEAYQDGLLSGVANTLGATWNTAANGVGWAWNQVVNSAEWALGAIGLDGLGNAAAWLIS